MDNANASAIEKLAALFPQCVTERKREDGTVEKAVDFEKLREELEPNIIEESRQQRYAFTWPDKRAYSMLANAPSERSLRPCREESRGRDGAAGAFDSANVYIEGDNLEVLKLLRETYFGKVKMIYIDPPYNTGNDFIYKDKFVQDEDEYLENSGQLDEEGARLFPNTESNGRFHTDWLNMIYPRLKVARNLLADDGVIFISIDDNEAANLRKVCDELFGEGNFVGQIPWQSRASIQNDTDFSINHEYILVYAKYRRRENRRLKESNQVKWHKKDSFVCRPLPLDKSKFDNPDNDPRGLWKADPFDAPHVRPNLTYPIVNPNTGEEHFPPRGRCWRTDRKQYDKAFADNRIVFGKGGTGRPQLKVFYEEKKDFGSIDNSWFSAERIGTATAGTKELMALFDGVSYFDNPKPTSLLKKLLYLANTQDNDLVLDFFSGSATTAHAVMQLNAEDGGNRRFILVQLPEKCGEDSEAFKAGFSNICEIGKERIRRAGDQVLRRAIEELEKEGVIEKCCLEAEADVAAGIVSPLALDVLRRFGYKIRAELLADAQGEEASSKLSALSSKLCLDTGFRVFKVDSSNMLDVYVTPAEFTADSIYEENIKKDRTPDDLLIQAMLDVGLELSSFVEERKIEGKRVFFVGEGRLAACFDAALTGEVILQIAKTRPECFYMRDAGFTCDCDCDNFAQIFKAYSPRTIRRAL